ncbi:ribosomal protein S16 domain-containing protein [Fimicolochytrium jonesii]|uniref:ribosomal protein S16 domain-containing protein n=1 Tax=Fimicolochytrium jonesii TaxID=1396493 RepID=UPI0022FEE63F|nr:ribosomal protein S16 domain-containing protein [Fimicolochytrium jonesii]KAI8816421.1 ribosomal protein S16 domain-containing protein [Fimicolochytrium jonesii]
MVVRIRLAQWGQRHNPFYGIVVTNHRAARDGKYLERVGTYNPIPDATGIKRMELNADRIKHWLGVGAQPSDRVAWLLAKLDLMPLKPRQLQNQGTVSVNDPKTWEIQVRNASGAAITHLTASEARNLLSDTELGKELPKDHPPKPPATSSITHETLKLDGTPPAQPLTAAERLLVLQKLTGIQR